MSSLVLRWVVLTVSFFLTISLFWLGLMVLLAGNRRSAGTWLTGSGLLLASLFFTSHTAILGRGLSSTSFGMDFWWWVSWAPAAVAPLAWYGALLWYSDYRLGRPHRHHFWLALTVLLAVSFALLLIFANPLPSYGYVVGRVIVLTPSIAGIPVLIVVYVIYSLLCYLLPLDLLHLASSGAPTARPLEARARGRARPYLVAASVALLLAGILLAWTALWALTTRPAPSLRDAHVEQIVQEYDLAVEALVALAVTLLGRAIVGFEVFTGRPLPRNRFLRQWRSTVILAGGFGAAAAWTLTIELRPIYSLMLATGLMTLFYALYSWRSFVEREEFMERLRPFVTSQDLYSQMTAPQAAQSNSATDGARPECFAPRSDALSLRAAPIEGAKALFETLCRDVLEVRLACLAPTGALATLAGPPLTYPAGEEPPALDPSHWTAVFSRPVHALPAEQAGAQTGCDWAVPLWSRRGLDGVLFLGEKVNGSPFTEEEIEIAQTAGERLLDLLAGTEMARLAMDLLRQRLAQARLIDGQGRRVLHDEVLPELHTALLLLSSYAQDAHAPAEPVQGTQVSKAQVQQAMEALAGAHRQIADLMREMPASAPHRLAQGGLAAALRALIEHDFASVFNEVEWQIEPEAEAYARGLPLFISEVLFFAARELVRNAAVHGREAGEGGYGSGSQKDLHLKIGLALPGDLCLTVEDDGAGYRPEKQGSAGSQAINSRGGAGSGIRIHSAMLAAVGARLEVLPLPERGTRAVIYIAK